jgi:hypothetical protein
MAIATGACPSCGAPITFRAGASMAVVCAHCKHVIARSDRGLATMGRVADVVFSDTALAPGDHGSFQGRSFEVHGRLVLQHPAGGTWEEYYALFDGRYPGWIAEAQGRWYVMQEVSAPVPALSQLPPGTAIALGAYGQFVVRERNQGNFLSAEGELPFAAQPGTPRVFVDLDAASGASASIDFAEGGPPRVYIGVETTFDALAVVARGGPRPEQRVGIQEIKCPSCGGPLPMHASGKSERVACVYCGALSDLATHRVIAQQDKNRALPQLPLGRTGELAGVMWTVIGYVVRSTVIEGESFTWQEYLLYEPNAGYRWIVVDEGVWRFCTAVSAADIDTSNAPRFIRYKGQVHHVRNDGTARVDYVLGEFYWRVEVGETVQATDFERGNLIVSREASGQEINWTLGTPMDGKAVARAFGIEAPADPIVAPGIPFGLGSSGDTKKVVWIVLGVMVVCMFLLVAAIGSGDEDGGGVRGSNFGGMGGK